MKKMHYIFRVASVFLLLASLAVFKVRPESHYDFLLDLYIPLSIVALSVYELILIQERRLGLAKIIQLFMLMTLLFTSIYHIQKHFLDLGNSTLLIGEFIIITLILIFDNEDFTRIKARGLLYFCASVIMIISLDFLISYQMSSEQLSQSMLMLGRYLELILFIGFFILLIVRGFMVKGLQFIANRGIILAILFSAVLMSYLPINVSRMALENISIFMKWFAYLLLTDLIISNLKSDMQVADEMYMTDYFEAFQKNVNAFMLIQKNANAQYVIKALNSKAEMVLQLKSQGAQSFTFDDFFELDLDFNKSLSETGTHMLLDKQVNRLDRTSFYADIQVQTIHRFDLRFSIVDIRDITKRKEILKKIAIRESVFSNAVEAIMIVDENDKIVDVNPSFEKIYQFNRFECIGSKPSLIKSGMMSDAFYKKMQSEIEEKGFFQGEFINRTQSGEIVTLNQSITKLFLEETDECYYVSIASDISEKKKSESMIFDLAFKDSVSKIYNRTFLLQNKHSYTYQVAALITITDYKLLIGYFDKEFLDILMSAMVRRLETLVNHGNLFQWSENQILVLIRDRDEASTDHFKQVIANLFDEMTQNILIVNQKIHPEITITWIQAKEGQEDMQDDLHYLEATLTHALKQGIKVLEYSQKLEAEFERAKQIEILLKDAILKNELFVLYQPIIDIQENVVRGFEALVRWQSPSLGIIHPLEFITVAESNQTILSLGLYVANKAFELMQEIQSDFPGMIMAINVSVVQLMDHHFFEQIHNLTKRYGLLPQQIALEITESQNLYDIFNVTQNLANFRDHGYLISIDDFGTGFSSLSRINEINPDFIKIDKAFFDTIETSVQSTLLTNGIIAFTDQIGLNVIAEGIETVEQLIYLKNQNVRYIQGFIFSYPISDSQVRQMIEIPMDIEGVFSEEVNEDLKLLKKLDDSIMNEHIQLKDLSYVEFDESLKIISCSRSFMELIGYEFESIINETIDFFFVEEDYEIWKDLFNKPAHAFMTTSVTSLGKEIRVMVNSKMEFDENLGGIKVYCIIKNLSDQANVIQQFLLEQESFIKFFEFSPLPSIVWEGDFNIVVSNEQAMQFFKNPESKMDKLNLKKVLSEDAFKEFSYYYNRLFAGYAQEFTMSIVDNDDNFHETFWHNAPLFDDNGEVKQVLTIIQDLTELNRQTEISRILSNAADLSDRLIIYTNEVNEILFANRKTIEMFELSEYGFNIYSMDDLDIKLIDKNSASVKIEALGYEPWSGVAQIKDKNGNIRVYDALRDGSYYKDAKLIKGYLFTFKDRHDDFKDQQEIDILKRALLEQDRLVSMGKLVAGIAHEINNPLSYLLSNTQFLIESEDELKKALPSGSDLMEDLVDVFGSFNEGLNTIKTIVSDLKTYSRKDDEGQKTDCDINSIIQQTLRIAHNEIKYTSIVNLDLENDLPHIMANSSKLQQVFLNLIINANHAIIAQYQNGMGEITIRTLSEMDGVICTIEDNGVGMPEEVLEHIFEAFYTTKDKGIGTGLGLSVSKEIIEEYHKGKIWAESTLGFGTKFSIKLPLEEARDQ